MITDYFSASLLEYPNMIKILHQELLDGWNVTIKYMGVWNASKK